MSERPHLEANKIGLPTTAMSDWRLVLQDSISTDDLRQGCISLFEQVNSGQIMTQIEVIHASRFLKYSGTHMKHRGTQHNKLLETIFPETEPPHTKLTNALITLVCHPSDTLQIAALSFLDAAFSTLSKQFYVLVTTTALLPQLLERLKPHEIPLSGPTNEFHSHIISILDKFFSSSSPKYIEDHLGDQKLASELIDAIFQPSSIYLHYLITAPVCSSDYRSGIALLSTTRLFETDIMNNDFGYIFKGFESFCEEMRRTSFESLAYVFNHPTTKPRSSSNYPQMHSFLRETRTELLEELASILGLESADEAELCLHSDKRNRKPTYAWFKGFERLLGLVGDGRRCFDLGMLAVVDFLSNRPNQLELFFYSEDKFGLKINDTIVSSSPLDAKSLWTLFTPTQTQHAAIILTAFRRFMNHEDSVTFMKYIWNDWFPNFVNAVDPSKL
ncbi:hypothetical protein BLNAU_5261 [Blattamonas nauphoetae]|uniref:Uncharacterized protein n=1 Tax=Blattamonas nauphoetae TaxID=2049346 RepID=A0ABQ9Y7N1_9EUKA|nr:hypothetical protein BLNAU_5261 [Blattamonas nauphoetae]